MQSHSARSKIAAFLSFRTKIDLVCWQAYDGCFLGVVEFKAGEPRQGRKAATVPDLAIAATPG